MRRCYLRCFPNSRLTKIAVVGECESSIAADSRTVNAYNATAEFGWPVITNVIMNECVPTRVGQ